MNTLVERVISYDLLNRSWNLNIKSGQKSLSRRSQNKTVYWGAKQSPLKISVGRSEHLPNRQIQTRTFIQYKQNKPILGPLIGILTTQGSRYPFSGVRSNFIDIIKAGTKKGAIVFVFTPECLRWEKDEVDGYLYHPKLQSWKKATFPLPNIVYNRIPNRVNESIDHVQNTITRLQQVPGLVLFNPHFFNKKELFDILEDSPNLAEYLPKTASLSSARDLQKMLKSFNVVYLKPTKGKAGSGIMKLSYDPASKLFRLFLYKKKGSKVLQMKSLSKLWSVVQQQRSSSPYIIQQGIELAMINQCPFDVRTLVQKDNKGEWQVTGIGIRVAGVNQFTTHVPRGGRIEAPDRVLGHLFTNSKSLQQKIKRLAIEIASHLELHYTHLGEMSMDIGVESNGDLWFFEANSKPMKFDEPLIRNKSLENIIAYSHYLTFGPTREESRTDAIAQSN